MRKATFLFISLITLTGCIQYQDEGKLPILGPREAEHKTVDGKDLIDTVYHTIDNFQFVNQDSAIVNNETFKGKYYVADFFFTSCPTICPIMSANMLTLYDDFKGEPNLNFLSHTIDTRHDSVKVLKRYSTKLGVSSDRWHFVTGPKDDIYGIAKSYLVSAKEDKNSPGGYIHSGALILVDGQGRIRAYYDGTKEEDIVKMKRAIKAILSQ